MDSPFFIGKSGRGESGCWKVLTPRMWPIRLQPDEPYAAPTGETGKWKSSAPFLT